MAGLRHIKHEYDKSTLDKFKFLLSRPYKLSEKLDGNRFAFEKLTDGSFSYFKRDARNPITYIDRTMMRCYESAINHFENLSEETKSHIPVGIRFGFENFVTTNPVKIAYDTMPRNGLVLTDGNLDSDDQRPLQYWTQSFECGDVPQIKEGHLNRVQITKIIEFCESTQEELQERFTDISFTDWVYNDIFERDATGSYMMDDITKSVEGFVLEFQISNDKKVSLKLVDPAFTKSIMDSKNTPRKSSDSYAISIVDFVDHWESKSIESYSISESHPDKRYIELMCNMFNEYLSENSFKYDRMSFDVEDFARKPEYDLNYDFINRINESTHALVVDNQTNKDLFRMLLGTFMKPRKRTTDVISKPMKESINKMVSKIRRITKQTESQSIILPKITDHMKK